MRIRCATLNLQGLEHEWFEKRIRAVIKGLRKFRPDIVCLQESTIRYAGTVYNQAHEIGQGIGLKAVAFSPYGNPIEVMSPNQGGIAVISRWPLLNVRHRPLPIGHDRPPDARVALLVTVQSPRGPIDVVTTHLSWMPVESPLRTAQLGMVLDEFSASDWASPTSRAILMGDFNATEDEPAIELACERLKDAYRAYHADNPGYTWVSSNPLNRGWKNMPNRRLDYIFCPKKVRVVQADVILDRAAPTTASDHYGVFAELEWTERETIIADAGNRIRDQSHHKRLVSTANTVCGLRNTSQSASDSTTQIMTCHPTSVDRIHQRGDLWRPTAGFLPRFGRCVLG